MPLSIQLTMCIKNAIDLASWSSRLFVASFTYSVKAADWIASSRPLRRRRMFWVFVNRVFNTDQSSTASRNSSERYPCGPSRAFRMATKKLSSRWAVTDSNARRYPVSQRFWQHLLTSDTGHVDGCWSVWTLSIIDNASWTHAEGTEPSENLLTMASKNTRDLKKDGNLHLAAHSERRRAWPSERILNGTSWSSGRVFKTSRSWSRHFPSSW